MTSAVTGHTSCCRCQPVKYTRTSSIRPAERLSATTAIGRRIGPPSAPTWSTASSKPYELLFSNNGGIPLEHSALIDDGRACALEYNVVGRGETELPPQAGAAVYLSGESGTLAAARVYDDVDPPLGGRR